MDKKKNVYEEEVDNNIFETIRKWKEIEKECDEKEKTEEQKAQEKMYNDFWHK